MVIDPRWRDARLFQLLADEEWRDLVGHHRTPGTSEAICTGFTPPGQTCANGLVAGANAGSSRSRGGDRRSDGLEHATHTTATNAAIRMAHHCALARRTARSCSSCPTACPRSPRRRGA